MLQFPDNFPTQQQDSVLFITLDSCRYDTFEAADVPNMRAVGNLHRTYAPGNFTYASHMAMFMGFTPGDPQAKCSFLNPKYGKIFRMSHGGLAGKGRDHFTLNGRSIVDGFRRRGYRTLASGAVGWFNPETETARHLIEYFDDFFYPGTTYDLERQLAWLSGRMQEETGPLFLFLNIGETHVPYYYRGAAWSVEQNPCIPFAQDNDRQLCIDRQRASLEFVDRQIQGLLDAFRDSTVVICADHGDCWGEDGLWEHGISHPKVMEVPLIFRLADSDQ